MNAVLQRTGDWMSTASGGKFWPLDPRADEVRIEDIAAALSKICRYGGHCRWHYSVAQHSVYVSHRVPAEFALIGLLHDATEAYCADVPRPLKKDLAGYAQIESRIWLAIAERFGLPCHIPEEVHAGDDAVLVAEMQQLLVRDPDWKLPNVEPAKVTVSMWTPHQAQDAFLRRFHELRAALGVRDTRRPHGCALAMRVMQSNLYTFLDEAERAECDELVQRNLEWAKADAGVSETVDGAQQGRNR